MNKVLANKVLRFVLSAIAVVALLTGINVLVGGASAVPGAGEPLDPAVDNELRFFSVFWVAYGAFSFWVAKNIKQQMHFVPMLAVIFLLGGFARLLSVFSLGLAHPILTAAMLLEFVLPILIFYLYRKQQGIFEQAP